MAAQALGLCGDPESAFAALMKEARQADLGYVFLFALNALQFSHTDDRLTREDWEAFKVQVSNASPQVDPFGYDYANRIVTDGLALWPERRRVD